MLMWGDEKYSVDNKSTGKHILDHMLKEVHELLSGSLCWQYGIVQAATKQFRRTEEMNSLDGVQKDTPI